MVFSSKIFLFYFLPFTLAGYFLLRRWRRASNFFLMLMSLVFYAWGEPKFVFAMLASIAFNYAAALVIERLRERRSRNAKAALAAAVAGNLALIGVWILISRLAFPA